MTRLDIRLLGEFAVFDDGAPLTTVNSPRLQGLLAYLLLHRDAPVSRQGLAFRFWPDSTEEQALSNLRNLLLSLNRALPNGEPFVEGDRQTVRWRSGAAYTLDVDSLLAALEKAQTAKELQEALDLYRGPLMPSCYDDWIVPERERLEEKVAGTVQKFIDRLEKEGAYRDAITFAHFLVRRDPLREDLYRQIMRLFALSGDRPGIARIYKECREVLKRELDVEPSRQTVTAYEKYVRMDVSPAPVPPPVAPAPPPGPSTAERGPMPVIQTHAPTPQVSDPPVRPVSEGTGRLPAVSDRRAPISAASLGVPANRASAAALQPVTDTVVRRAVLSGALQHPSTEIPLALACTAGIYLLLWHPFVAVPALSMAAWGLLALSTVAAVGSFIYRYGVKFDESYEQIAHGMMEAQNAARGKDEEEVLAQLRERLTEGFKEIRLAEGLYVLRDLDYEYLQLRLDITRQQETNYLSLAHLPSLVRETYGQGLSILEDTLDLARAVTSPKDQRLGAEIKELEGKISAGSAQGGDDVRAKMWQEKLAGLRQRQETIARGRLRSEEMLQQASSCETALNHTRVELANLKADSWTVSLNAVLETLQKTIDQAKAVQDEMRKLGY